MAYLTLGKPVDMFSEMSGAGVVVFDCEGMPGTSERLSGSDNEDAETS